MSADKKKADRYHPLDNGYEKSKLLFPNQDDRREYLYYKEYSK